MLGKVAIGLGVTAFFIIIASPLIWASSTMLPSKDTYLLQIPTPYSD
jgi:hypothetical protein